MDYKTKYPKQLAEDIGNELAKHNITVKGKEIIGLPKEKIKGLREKVEQLITKHGLSIDAYEKKGI